MVRLSHHVKPVLVFFSTAAANEPRHCPPECVRAGLPVRIGGPTTIDDDVAEFVERDVAGHRIAVAQAFGDDGGEQDADGFPIDDVRVSRPTGQRRRGFNHEASPSGDGLHALRQEYHGGP